MVIVVMDRIATALEVRLRSYLIKQSKIDTDEQNWPTDFSNNGSMHIHFGVLDQGSTSQCYGRRGSDAETRRNSLRLVLVLPTTHKTYSKDDTVLYPSLYFVHIITLRNVVDWSRTIHTVYFMVERK